MGMRKVRDQSGAEITAGRIAGYQDLKPISIHTVS